MNTFTPKAPTEVEVFSFDFVNNLAHGETIVSGSSVITIKSGIDPAVGSMVSGAVGINGSRVSQLVQGGVDGAYYYLTMTVVTTIQVLVGRAILPVSVDK